MTSKHLRSEQLLGKVLEKQVIKKVLYYFTYYSIAKVISEIIHYLTFIT